MSEQTSFSRRSLLGQIPAAALTTTAISPIAVIAVGASAEILAAKADLKRIAEAIRNAAAKMDEVRALYKAQEPKRPLSLAFLEDDTIEQIRTLIEYPQLLKIPPWKGRTEDEAKEIVAIYDQWQAECEALKERLGYQAAHDAYNVLLDEEGDAIDRLIEVPAKNFEDLKLKASALIDGKWDEERLSVVIQELAEFGSSLGNDRREDANV